MSRVVRAGRGGTVALQEVERFLDRLLEPWTLSDYGPNGLQVEGRALVGRLAVAVSAHMRSFEAAVEAGADALLVHHGILWNHQDGRIKGPLGRRVRFLLEHDLGLLAYHLPLDRHPEVGNAAALARRLGLEVEGGFGDHKGQPIGVEARAATLSAAELRARLVTLLGEPVTVYPAGPEPIERVAIATGGAQDHVQQAIDGGFHAFLTGEVTEWTRATVEEAGIHYFAGGHYRTERYGVQELGERLADAFGVEVLFLDQPNPV